MGVSAKDAGMRATSPYRDGKNVGGRKVKDEPASAHAAALPETELWLPPSGWARKEYELDRKGRTAEADEWALAMEQDQEAVP